MTTKHGKIKYKQNKAKNILLKLNQETQEEEMTTRAEPRVRGTLVQAFRIPV